MQINKISNINFRENQSVSATGSQNAILMLRDPNASVKFQQNKEIAQKADMLSTNPITAIGYKLYRTFNMMRSNNENTSESKRHLNTIA